MNVAVLGTLARKKQSSWLSGYSYRKSFTYSRASGAVENYQVKIQVGESSGATGEDVDCGGHCLATFNDLRFTDSDGNLLDYWIESISGTTPNQLATVWVELDSVGTSATTFYMYYGKADASAASSGADTFIFFDDFPGDAIDTDKWDVTASSTVGVADGVCTLTGRSSADSRIDTDTQWGSAVAFRGRVKTGHYDSGSYREFGGLRVPSGTDEFSMVVSCHASYSIRGHHWCTDNGDSTGDSEAITGLVADTWATWDICRNGSTTVIHRINNANEKTLNAKVPDANLGICFVSGTSTSAKVYLDWVLIRYFLATEPAFGSWGSEESA